MKLKVLRAKRIEDLKGKVKNYFLGDVVDVSKEIATYLIAKNSACQPDDFDRIVKDKNLISTKKDSKSGNNKPGK